MLLKISTVIAVLTALTSASLVPRAIVHPGGTIVEPSSGSLAIAGQYIPFKYINTDQCHAGYSPITVYLLDHAPSASEVADNGTFTNFTHFFGELIIPNFGTSLTT